LVIAFPTGSEWELAAAKMKQVIKNCQAKVTDIT
jgi:hypothetical protein